jgi:hypothetical protein
MAVKGTTISVTTAAVVNPSLGADYQVGERITVQPSNGSIRIGGSDVTASVGLLVQSGQSFSDVFEAGEQLYAVSVTGSAVSVDVYRGGV